MGAAGLRRLTGSSARLTCARLRSLPHRPGSSRRRPRAPRAHRGTEHVRTSGRRHVCRRRQPHRLLRRRRRGPRATSWARCAPPGLQPRIDPAGNIFARRDGTAAALPPILFGSHIDSVPNGGNFDGDLGSLSALGALEALARGGRPHAASARDGGLGARRELRVRPRPRLQPHRRRRRHAGGHGRGLERHAPRRRDPADRRRPGSHPRGAAAEGRRITATSSCTSSRAARSSAPASRSASSRASSRSTATRRSSPASPTTPARRRLPSGTTRCSRPRT